MKFQQADTLASRTQSVFGMNVIEISPNDWRFVVTMIGVCVPFFILIFIMQTHAGMSLFRRVRLYVKGFGESRRQKATARREQRSQLQQTEMIRRQSCATTVVAGKRESVWDFDSNAAACGGTAERSLRLADRWRAWWTGRKAATEDAASSAKVLNV